VVESLPIHQQESLIDILRHRLIEHKQELLAKKSEKQEENLPEER
jgi:hypothetical protein